MASLSLNRLPLVGKIGVGLLLCSLVGASYFFLFDAEVESRTKRERGQTGELEDELGKIKQAQRDYFADRDEAASRQQRQRELNKVLPTDTEAATILSALQSVSNVSGIDLKAWAPMEEVPQAFYAKVPMKLTITGRFHQIAKFVYEVGKQDRIINMENLELSDPKVEGDDVILKATCLATSFHALKKQATPVQTPGSGGGK
jgi:type IV pilus assembly protein PilO